MGVGQKQQRLAQQGYALVLGVLGSALLLVWWSQLYLVGQRLNQAHQLRTALDAAAYSGAVVQTRSLNVLALLNRAYMGDRKSTRLNSRHVSISYAIFCLKKKKLI